MQVPPLTSAPILPTLWRLSLPNMAAMLATALVAVAETLYVGRLGTAALAGMALVFPMVMLQQMMSAGSMGGGISSAISRALGAGDEARAQALARHATLIGACLGLFFTVLMLLAGPALYRLLGGRDAALAQALAFSNTVFMGSCFIWLTNTFASVLRGCGNMKTPSAILLAACVLQVLLGGALGLGLGSWPGLGMLGVALGQVIAFGCASALLFAQLRGPRARLPLRLRGALDGAMFADILKVGALASLSSLQTVLTILIVTGLIARFGTEALAGYGIGVRLEFLLIPITFAVGVACVPLVGMAIGAGNVARARKVAWTGSLLAAGLVGAVGMLVALWPDLWAARFTDQPPVLDAARSYLRWAAPCYAFLGLGMCLYFASQGSGKLLGPVLAGTLRLLVVGAGGWWLLQVGAPAWTMFALIGAGLVAYGSATALSVWLTRWGG